MNKFEILKYLFLCFLCVVYSNFSQTSKDLQVTIDAFILDYSTKEPIAFAEIELLNKNLGTLSDDSGKFSLTFLQSKVEPETILEISSPGFNVI